MRKLRILILFVALGIVLGMAWPVQAVPIGIGGPWNEFSFTGAGVPAKGCSPADPAGPSCTPSGGGNSVFVGAPPWTFVAPGIGAALTVTDAFLRGDMFDIFDFGAPIGSTSVVGVGGSCGSDPVLCLADPLVSSGLFALGAGGHSITITPNASPFAGGAAYFRVDAVPEPATLILLGSGLVGLAFARRRMKR